MADRESIGTIKTNNQVKLGNQQGNGQLGRQNKFPFERCYQAKRISGFYTEKNPREEVARIFNQDHQSAYNRETLILFQLEHPNLMRIYDSNPKVVFNGQPSMIIFMEQMQTNFQDLVEKQSLPVQSAKEYFKQLVELVNYLHSKDLVHCNLKTSNIFLDKEQLLRVGDLGFHRKFLGGNDFLNLPIFDEEFQAPELKKIQDIDLIDYNQGKPIDIYSIGKILEKLLSQQEKNQQPVLSLIKGMTEIKPYQRLRIEEIRKNQWISDQSKQSEIMKINIEPDLNCEIGWFIKIQVIFIFIFAHQQTLILKKYNK